MTNIEELFHLEIDFVAEGHENDPIKAILPLLEAQPTIRLDQFKSSGPAGGCPNVILTTEDPKDIIAIYEWHEGRELEDIEDDQEFEAWLDEHMLAPATLAIHQLIMESKATH